MTTRTGNYAAFYVREPYHPSALSAHATADFSYYNMLRMWKGRDSSFPFEDSHALTYSVRDGSDWESTLKPRLRSRLRASKNVVLFLSITTAYSPALIEEIEYGINDQGLPVIVIYPSLSTKSDIVNNGVITPAVTGLWGRLPVFKRSMGKVPVLHLPLQQSLIADALRDRDFMLGSTRAPGNYWFIP